VQLAPLPCHPVYLPQDVPRYEPTSPFSNLFDVGLPVVMIEGQAVRGSLVAALLLFVAAQAGCYLADVRPGARAPEQLAAVRADAWPIVEGLRLHVFNTGMNRVSSLLIGSPAPWRPAPAFVIEHPKHGLIVFDAGLGPEIGERGSDALHFVTRRLFKTCSLPGRDLASQMRKAGMDPAAVATVVLSHLHFDHVGAAPAFVSARFYAGANERASSRSRMNGFEPTATDWVPPERWPEVDFSNTPPFATFDHSLDLFGDGSVVLVAGGGHTPGDLGALVALPEGPVLLTGDMVVHFDWLEHDDVQRIAADAERAADVRNRIRRFLELVPGSVVIPGHDLSRLPTDRSDLVAHDPAWLRADAWPLNAP
jgi:N-acyl homoserine lactone hydrolase